MITTEKKFIHQVFIENIVIKINHVRRSPYIISILVPHFLDISFYHLKFTVFSFCLFSCSPISCGSVHTLTHVYTPTPACNRTYYGEVGTTYEVELHRPKPDKLPFICHLIFTASGGSLGDLIQVSSTHCLYHFF